MFDKWSTINYQTGKIETYWGSHRFSGSSSGGIDDLFVLLALIVGAILALMKK